MKLVNKIAIEMFIIASKTDYPFLRDTLLPKLSEECGVPILVNGFISIEDKEATTPPNSTGAILIAVENTKLPLSLNKLVSNSIMSLSVPAIFTTTRDPVVLKKEIFEAFPPFSIYAETSKALKKGIIPSAFSFESFKNLLLENKDMLFKFFPLSEEELHSKTNKKKQGTETKYKENMDLLVKFVEQKVQELCSPILVLTPHLLLQYFKDVFSFLNENPNDTFTIEFMKTWLHGVHLKYPEKDMSFYEKLFTDHFLCETPLIYREYLNDLLPKVEVVNETPIDDTKTIEFDTFNISYTHGVSLSIKEVISSTLKTNGSISIDSLENNKIINLLLTE